MLRRYLIQLFWRLVFPGDRPSASLAVFAVVINVIVILATSAAWHDATEDECAPEPRSWLIIGVINNGVHAIFGIYFVLAVRRRARNCLMVPLDTSVYGFVLRDIGAALYAVFLAWVIVWISLTYHRFPIASTTGVRSIEDVYVCDLCCTFCTVVSSISVFYIAGVVFIVAATLVTEGFHEPRWWSTMLLRDMRQREIDAYRNEIEPQPTQRANSNADTDRDMMEAGYMIPQPRVSTLRNRRGYNYQHLNSREVDEIPIAPVSLRGQGRRNKLLVPPAAVTHTPMPSSMGGPPSSSTQRDTSATRRQRRQVRFEDDTTFTTQEDVDYWTSAVRSSTRGRGGGDSVNRHPPMPGADRLERSRVQISAAAPARRDPADHRMSRAAMMVAATSTVKPSMAVQPTLPSRHRLAEPTPSNNHQTSVGAPLAPPEEFFARPGAGNVASSVAPAAQPRSDKLSAPMSTPFDPIMQQSPNPIQTLPRMDVVVPPQRAATTTLVAGPQLSRPPPRDPSDHYRAAALEFDDVEFQLEDIVDELQDGQIIVGEDDVDFALSESD